MPFSMRSSSEAPPPAYDEKYNAGFGGDSKQQYANFSGAPQYGTDTYPNVTKEQPSFSNMNSKTTSGAPVKSYKLVSQSVWTEKIFQIQQNGQSIIWVRNKRGFFKAPVVQLHVNSEHGEVVAACKLQCWKRHLLYYTGNPDCTDKEDWSTAKSTSWTEKCYEFQVGGQTFAWKRTHNKELGASRWGSKHFKLVDQSGTILAVFIFTQSIFGKIKQIADIEFFQELDQRLEVTSLAIIMGIEEAIRQNERAAAATA